MVKLLGNQIMVVTPQLYEFVKVIKLDTKRESLVCGRPGQKNE